RHDGDEGNDDDPKHVDRSPFTMDWYSWWSGEHCCHLATPRLPLQGCRGRSGSTPARPWFGCEEASGLIPTAADSDRPLRRSCRGSSEYAMPHVGSVLLGGRLGSFDMP